MAANRKTGTMLAVSSAVIAMVILFFLNVLADRFFVRVDLTAERRFSLSSATLKITEKLQVPLRITYYVSRTWPQKHALARREILDKLRELEIFAQGRVLISVVDPGTDREKWDALYKKKIFPRPVQDQVDDKTEIINFFSGFELTYQDKKSLTIPFLIQPDELEYQLMRRMLKLTLKELPTIALYYPQPDPMQAEMMRKQGRQPAVGFEWIAHENALGELFSIRIVDLSKEQPIPDDAKVLILIRPEGLHERQRYEIERFLASGGTILLFTAPFRVDVHGGQRVAARKPSGLEQWLNDLGLAMHPDFVCDKNCWVRRWMDEYGRAAVGKDPYQAVVIGANMDQKSVLSRRLPGLIMPFPAAMKLDDRKFEALGLSLQILATTSAETWREPYSELIPEVTDAKLSGIKSAEKQPLMVLLEGQFPFSYAGKPAPLWPDKRDDSSGVSLAAETAIAPELQPGRLLVCSSPDMLRSLLFTSPEELQWFMGVTIPFLQNATEAFSLGDELLRIRIRSYETREIDTLPSSEYNLTRNLIKVALIGGTPFLAAIFWLSKWILRRRRQVLWEKRFAETTGPSSFTP
jgi:hypothetical protein